MSEVVIRQWLKAMTDTVAKKDLQAHMKLISPNLCVYGMPDGQIIGYEGWEHRRKNEFKHSRLKGLTYKNLRIKTIALKRLAFQIDEIMEGAQGELILLKKDNILEQESDSIWRLVEQKIRGWKVLSSKQEEAL